MFRKDIDLIFTQKVQEYLSNGYTIHTKSMGGTQGEIASVHLQKNEEIICIVLNSTSFKIDNYKYDDSCDGIELVVGKHVAHGIVWYSKLEKLEVIKFYKVNRFSYENFYTTNILELNEMLNVRSKRIDLKYTHEDKEYSDKFKKIILKLLKRKRGYGMIKVKDITSIIKVGNAFEVRFLKNGKREYKKIYIE